VESLAAERDGLAKVLVDLEARLKESDSRLEESEGCQGEGGQTRA